MYIGFVICWGNDADCIISFGNDSINRVCFTEYKNERVEEIGKCWVSFWE